MARPVGVCSPAQTADSSEDFEPADFADAVGDPIRTRSLGVTSQSRFSKSVLGPKRLAAPVSWIILA